MTVNDRIALKRWEKTLKSIRKATVIDMDEEASKKEARIDYLLLNPIEFFKYYFPHYCSSDFATFQKEAINKVTSNEIIYAAFEWARDHAKSSTFAPLIALYLKFAEKDVNLLLVSYNESNAVKLLEPIKLELEANQRILNDFGVQKSLSNWEAKSFVTLDGCSFRAIGSGQSPRGTRNEEKRPNIIIVDDLDEDEMLRNPRRLDQTWQWVQGALFNCFDIAGKKRFIVINNRIAQDCIMARAITVADFHSRVDATRKARTNAEKEFASNELSKLKKQIKKAETEIERRTIQEAIKRLEAGQIASWYQRYSMLDLCYMFMKIGYFMTEREYFNNPITEGKIFKKDWIQYGKVPPLNNVKFLIGYLDPAFKDKKTSDTRSWNCVGLYKGKFYVYKMFCDRASTVTMVNWGYEIEDHVKEKNGTVQLWMEEVFLQDLLYKDFAAEAAKRNRPLALRGDKRQKPDKDSRISGLSGYFERGDIVFDEAEKDNHHMIRFQDQLLAFEPGVRTAKDGPDALEGAIFKLTEMIALNADIDIGTRHKSSNKL